MTTQTIASPQAQRIGRLKGEILAHVMPVEVFGKFGVKKPMPKNSSETVVFRRWLPKGATSASPNIWAVTESAHRLSEGETPVAEAITAQDVTVSLVEYGFVYRWSNRVEDLYEDDVPSEIKRMAGERMGLLLEMIRWGQLKACTNVFYPGGVTTRLTVVSALTAAVLRKASRSLQVNHAPKITSILSASPGVGTQPVEAAFVAICHTDQEYDIRQLTGFIHISEYGTRQAIHENELGSWENFRFITSPHLAPALSTCGAVAATLLAGGVAGNASNAGDTYSMIVLSQDAFGDVALRGKSAMNVNAFAASDKSKDDPLGQRGLIGAQTYFNCVRLNDLQMAVIESACSLL
jgi:N4-gp56 family major capsid protein